jgi:catalase (peroxidase I)
LFKPIIRDFLEQFKTPDISYADLWTLAGVVAIQNAGGLILESLIISIII